MQNNEELLELMLQQPSKYSDTYVRLANKRIIFLSEVFTKEVSSAMSALLMYYDNQNSEEDITIYINSVGGDAASLSNIVDLINAIKAPVKTVGIAACSRNQR